MFVGYYSFSSDFSPDLSGAKLRLESRIHRNITLDFEWFEDEELNDTEYFAGIRFYVPLGGSNKGGSTLATRMNEMVQRDFRIRTLQSAPQEREIAREVTVQGPNGGSPKKDPTPEPEIYTPTCFLDDDGNVVCD